MKAAIAAGHPLTAEAGSRVLQNGGNAVDSCIAAALAASVTEGPLTGPAGGGFLLLYVDRQPLVLDCFFAVPSRPLGEMEEIVIDFGDASTQVFHVGEASVAVPGLLAGLEHAHRRFGRLPWPDLAAPALELAGAGIDVSEAQAFLHRILSAILQRDEGGRHIYGSPGRLATDAYVATLEAVRDRGAHAVAELLPELEDDLAAYEVAEREPARTTFLGREVLAIPPPSRGGTIVTHALERLEGAATLDDRARAIQYGYASAPPARMAGTTHISVVDEHGDAAALSSTLGSGSGVFRGGTQLNNMLGELDVIGDGPLHPGDRLASMMTPTLVLEDGRPATGARQRRLRPSRGRDRPGHRPRPARYAAAGGDRRAAHPRRGRGAPPGGRHARRAAPRLGGRALGQPEPLLRRRLGRRAPCRRHLRRRRRPAPRRPRDRPVTVVIRPARADDAQTLVQLGSAVGREDGGWLLTTDGWRSVADERRYLRALRRYPHAAVFVAEDGDRIVGRLSLSRDNHPASSHVADLGLMVAATHRRRGIGRALLDQAVAWAREAGIRKLELHVFPWNEAAIRLYETYGFEREGIRRDHYRRDDDFVDAILMAYRVQTD